MNLHDQLIITLVDKAAIGLVVLLAGLFANRVLEKFKSREALANELRKQKEAVRLSLLGQRLSEFYWPLYLRFEKDNAVWRRILDRNLTGDEVKKKVGRQIETGYILPNHKEVVLLLEKRMHLAGGDSELITALVKYMLLCMAR